MQLKCQSGCSLLQVFKMWAQSKDIIFKDITLPQYLIHVKLKEKKKVCSLECNRIQEAHT